MLRLLLDEHISPDVAVGLLRQSKSVLVLPMTEWERGAFLGQEDELALLAAFTQGLTLVTYDCKTIPPLLKTWAEEERSHGGVIFVDDKTISPANVGGLIRALSKLIREAGDWDWNNRVYFLQP